MSTISANRLADMIRTAPAVYSTRTCREALRVMFQHPQSKCIVVCNAVNEPTGLLMSERFFLLATGRFAMDSFYRESVTKLMNTPLIFDISASPEEVLAAALNRSAAFKDDCIIVTRDGKLAGVAYPADLKRSLQ